MIMPQEFYTISLISVIAAISFSSLFASNLIDIQDYSQNALKIFRLYFIFGFLGWLFFGLIEFSNIDISLSWLAIAYMLAASMLLFMILGRVEINITTIVWVFSHIIFIIMELTVKTLEAELWIFTTYVLISMTVLSYIVLNHNKHVQNIGFTIISLALYIPLALAVGQAYLLLNQYSLDIVIGLGILGAASSYSLVGLGFLTKMLVMERDLYELQAHKDELTDIYNRRGLNNSLDYIVSDSMKESTSVSAIACDIDFFKKINDTYGHDIGDIALKEFAQLLKTMIRGNDLLARIGGEEFFIVLPKTDLNGAKILAEKIRKKTEDMIIQAAGESVKITASFGVTHQKKEINMNVLFKMTDEALYKAKTGGRNQVYVNQ